MPNINSWDCGDYDKLDLTGSNDNVEIKSNFIRINPQSLVTEITGLANPYPTALAAPVYIYNSSSTNSILLRNLDASSEPENQFDVGILNYTINPGDWVMLLYIDSKYRI